MPVLAGLYRQQKPPFGGPRILDVGNPLASALQFAVLFNEFGSTTVWESVGGQNLTLNGSAAWKSGSGGPAMDFSSTADLTTILAPSDTPYLGALTIMCRGVIRTGSTYNAFVGKVTSNGAANNPFDFRTDNSATPNLALVRAAAASFTENDGPAITLNKRQTWGATLANGILTTAAQFYVDGVATTATQQGGGGATNCTGGGFNIQIGRRPDGAVQLDGQLDYVYIWSRALSAPEVMAVTVEPFAMWLQPFRSIKVVLSSILPPGLGPGRHMEPTQTYPIGW